MKEVNNQNINDKEIKAKELMIENKYLESKLNLYKKYIIMTKDTMQKLFDKNNSAIKLFNSYINEIQKDYDKLNEQYTKDYYPKYESLIDECFNDISMGKPLLKQSRAQAFVYDYLNDEKDCLIKSLKESIKSSKHFHLFREPKRDNLVDIKEGNKIMEKTNTEVQQNVLYECKQYNKFSNRIKKYKYQIEEIKKNINKLNKYLNEEASKNQTNNNIILDSNNKPTQEKTEEKKEKENTTKNKYHYHKSNLKQSVMVGMFNPFFGTKENNQKEQNNSDENRSQGDEGDKYAKKKSGGLNLKKSLNKVNKTEKKRNKIIKEFQKVEDLFNSSSEESENEKLIDDELHSDDETVFEKKINNEKKLTTTHLKEIEKYIPKITLNQIEYNKMKIMKEADIYSLQRRKYKSQNIDSNIKELKKRIEKMNEKLNLIHKKEKIMKEYIDKKKAQYEIVKPMAHKTSVKGIQVEFIKKSIYGKDLIIEEENDEDLADGSVGSDYQNEEQEESDKEMQEIIKMKGDMKRSVFVGGFNLINNKKNKSKNKNKKIDLKQSVQDGIFHNKLRDNYKKHKRAKSK